MKPDHSNLFSIAIRNGGFRMTKQRTLILDILDKSQEHLDAETLHDLVRQYDAQIGLATVYRTLALLKEFGLVNEHDLGEEHGHFETIPDTPHHHFTCLQCRRVIEFEVPCIVDFAQALRTEKNIEITRVNLSFEGYCPDCIRKSGLR